MSSTTGRLLRQDQGRVSVLFAALTIGVLVVVGLGLDGGLALAGQTRAYHLAADAARAGASAVDLEHFRETGQARLDPQQAIATAQTRLDQAGADPATTVTATAEQVSVTVWHTEPTQLLGMVGLDSITTSATATAEPRHGITTPGDVPGGGP